MESSTTIVFLSFLLIVLLICGFFVLYVKSLLREIRSYSNIISGEIRLRLDMIPLMIETVRLCSFEDTELISGIIKIRQKSWPVEELSKDKVHNELNMSAALHTLWEMAMRYQDLQKDTNFLGLWTEIQNIGKRIEKLQNLYNQKIRMYNNKVNFFFLKPFLSLFRLRPMPIFEFEA